MVLTWLVSAKTDDPCCVAQLRFQWYHEGNWGPVENCIMFMHAADGFVMACAFVEIAMYCVWYLLRRSIYPRHQAFARRTASRGDFVL